MTYTHNNIQYKEIYSKPMTAKGYEDRTTLGLKRMNGKKLYIATLHPNGEISEPISI